MRPRHKGLPWALSGWIHSVSGLNSRLSVVRQTQIPVSFASLCCVLCSSESRHCSRDVQPRRHSMAAVATLLTVVWLLSPNRRACPVRAPASLLHPFAVLQR